MWTDKAGEYVLYTDYATLRAEVEHLRGGKFSDRDYTAIKSKCEDLQVEVERLKCCGNCDLFVAIDGELVCQNAPVVNTLEDKIDYLKCKNAHRVCKDWQSDNLTRKEREGE